jgi:transcriptional regulator with XRE-family HTH domain
MLHNLVRDFPVFLGYDPCVVGLTLSFYLTIMVHFPQSNTNRGARKSHPGESALALRNQTMDIVSVDAREIVRCAYRNCRLLQYRTSNSLCRKCHKPLDVEEPVKLAPQLVTTQPGQSTEAGLQVAGQVRDIRRARHLSQRQLAGRMEVPRTYISKIENGKAIPTLGSLERLARALEVDICQLVRDSRSRRDEEVAAIFNDPFLAEIAAALPTLDSLHRTLVMSAARDAAMGQRRTA